MELRGLPVNIVNITNASFTLPGGDSGTFSVTVTPVAGGPFAAYRLDSTGTYKSVSRKVSLTLAQTSCSRFAYLSDSETSASGTPVWFITNDILTGPVYTNGQLNISGNPTFNGPVSSVNSAIDYYNGGPPNDNPIFKNSLTLGAPQVSMPTAADLTDNIKNNAKAGGMYLTNESRITLLSNGKMNVDKKKNGNWVSLYSNVALPANGAVYVDGADVSMSGVLKGSLTVGTSNNIYITNNILYNTDPRTNPNSGDLLGLASLNNVYVDAAAPTNVEIDAYVVALNTSFSVANYDTGLKGTLTLYGGMTQENRGPVGTFNSGTNQKVSGYTKNYNYDTRLSLIAPAYFPPLKDANGRIIYLKVLWSET